MHKQVLWDGSPYDISEHISGRKKALEHSVYCDERTQP